MGAATDPGTAGEHGLVAVRIGQRLVDVGRQRHLAEVGQHVELVVGLVVQGDEPPAVVAQHRSHLDGQGPAVLRALNSEERPDGHAPTGAHQRLPPAFGPTFEQEHLHGAAGVLAQVQPGGDHPGVVDHEQVAGVEQVGQVGHGAVLDRSGRPVVHQEPGGVAGLHGVLGDRRRRQHVVELGGVHGVGDVGAGQAGGARRQVGEGLERHAGQQLRADRHRGLVDVERAGVQVDAIGSGLVDPQPEVAERERPRRTRRSPPLRRSGRWVPPPRSRARWPRPAPPRPPPTGR